MPTTTTAATSSSTQTPQQGQQQSQQSQIVLTPEAVKLLQLQKRQQEMNGNIQ